MRCILTRTLASVKPKISAISACFISSNANEIKIRSASFNFAIAAYNRLTSSLFSVGNSSGIEKLSALVFLVFCLSICQRQWLEAILKIHVLTEHSFLKPGKACHTFIKVSCAKSLAAS
tara:strand:+ start:462 stop:818 length:357 start_codon:yes stop_codon:yes gene_type:complete